MSVIANGFLRSTSAARFTGRFLLNDSHYIVAGSFAGSVLPFKSSSAVLKYNKEEDITGTKGIEGLVGPEKVVINFSNGVKIEGQLDLPVSPGSSVCGAAFFTQT